MNVFSSLVLCKSLALLCLLVINGEKRRAPRMRVNRKCRSKEQKQHTQMQTNLRESRLMNGLNVRENEFPLKQNSNKCLLNRTKEREKDDDDGFFGPALPPGFKKQQSSPER